MGTHTTFTERLNIPNISNQIIQSGISLEPTKQLENRCRSERHVSTKVHNIFKYKGPSSFHSIDDIMHCQGTKRITITIMISIIVNMT
jgi:hypothetical protein